MDDALQALDRCDRRGDVRAGNLVLARGVRKALAKKRAAAEVQAGEEPPERLPSFTIYKDDTEKVSCADVDKLVFGSTSTLNKSLLQQHHAADLSNSVAHRVRATTLWRYCSHRLARMNEQFFAPRPVAQLVGSMRLKWDETEQKIASEALEVDEDEDDGEGDGAPLDARVLHRRRRRAQKCHVMTTAVWVKTASSTVQPWLAAPMKLARTTAECIWLALQLATPMGPWSQLPSPALFAWFWIISCCDNASSNRRMHAHLEVACLKKRPGMLIAYSACMLHLIHRCIIPLLQVHDVLNNLYRLAHVLLVGAYWSSVCRGVRRVIKDSVYVTHTEFEASASNRQLAEHIIFLTVCEGKPLDQLTKGQRELRIDLLKHLIGSWVASNIKYACLDPDCPGGIYCLKKARAHVLTLFYRASLGRGTQIPVASRWWKAAPIARQILFAIGFHNVLPRAVPCRSRSNDQDPWHQLHSWRVRASFEYLNKADTAEHLCLLLISVVPSHFLMAWLMHHESDVRRLGATATAQESRRSVLLRFINPATSPVGDALALGAKMLTNATRSEHWSALFRLSTRSEHDILYDIWQSMLPCLALIFWKVQGAIDGWPLGLLRFLTCVGPARQALAGRFSSLRCCCVPRGILELWRAVFGHAERCLSDWFTTVVEELSWQFDLVNFDQEVNHAKMGSILDNTSGKSLSMEQLALVFLAKDITHRHAQLSPSAKPRPKGRPRKEKGKKRPLRSGWHAFVKHYKPTCPQAQQGLRIMTGEHLRELGARWRALSDADRTPFEMMRAASNAQDLAEESESVDDIGAIEEEETVQEATGAWSLGSGSMPFSPELMCEPAFSESLLQEVNDWLQQLGRRVEHSAGNLPSQTTVYDDPCCAGACRADPCFADAARLLKQFIQAFPRRKAADSFLVIAEGALNTRHYMFILGLRHDGGSGTMVFLPLQSRALAWDIESGSNLPWLFTLARKDDPTYNKVFLDFKMDIAFFLDVAKDCSKDNIHDIAVCPMNYKVLSLSEMEVESLGEFATLSSAVFADLSGLGTPVPDAADNVFEDLEALGPMRKPAPKQESKKQEHAQSSEEYAFEHEMARDAREALEAMEDDVADAQVVAALAAQEDHEGAAVDAGINQEEDLFDVMAMLAEPAALEVVLDAGEDSESEQHVIPEPPSRLEAAVRRPRRRAPPTATQDVAIEWERYDDYIIEDGTRLHDVLNADGRVIGQLQSFVGFAHGPYRVAARCYDSRHPNCSPLRTAKPREEPVHADRVLVRWLHQATDWPDTNGHMYRCVRN